MTIWLYCIIRNEAKLIEYFLRHYTTFVDRLEFFDDQSDDGTRDIIKACPKAVLSDWPGEHGIVDDQFLEFANQKWKEARGKADWVIWVDSDEFIYHPEILKLLEMYMAQGVDVPLIEGYGMVSNAFPTTDGQIYGQISTGFRSPEWDKPEIFRTTCNMVWNVGRHSFNEQWMVPYKSSDRAEIKLLHYRYLGLDYVTERNRRNFSRQPERCKRLAYGDNVLPNATKAYSTNWFEHFRNQPFPNVI